MIAQKNECAQQIMNAQQTVMRIHLKQDSFLRLRCALNNQCRENHTGWQNEGQLVGKMKDFAHNLVQATDVIFRALQFIGQKESFRQQI